MDAKKKTESFRPQVLNVFFSLSRRSSLLGEVKSTQKALLQREILHALNGLVKS
jgi:hypothetical protein